MTPTIHQGRRDHPGRERGWQPRDRRLTTVKRVLLTGMSGTGKSSVIRALAALGYKAIDTDEGWCELLPDGRQRWREQAIAGSSTPRTLRCCSSPGARRTRAASIHA